jgi:hypothetical protein
MMATERGTYWRNARVNYAPQRQAVTTPPTMKPLALGKVGDQWYSICVNLGAQERGKGVYAYKSDFAIYKISSDWKTFEEVKLLTVDGVPDLARRQFNAMVSPTVMIDNSGIYVAGYNFQKAEGRIATEGWQRYLTVVKFVGTDAKVLVSQQYSGRYDIRMHMDGSNLVVVSDHVSLTLSPEGKVLDSKVTSKEFTASGILHTGDSIRISATPSGSQYTELSVDGVTWKRYDKIDTAKYTPPTPKDVRVNLEL